MSRARSVCVGLFAVGVAILGVIPSSAEEQFFRGRTLSIICFSGPGGPYDTYSRLLARHLGKHLTGQPNVIVRNMPGAGGITAARHIAEVAARDGTAIGSLSRTLIYDPLLGANPANIDYSKMGWLGSMAQSTPVYVSWYTSRIKNVGDLRLNDLMIAGTGAGSETTVVSSVLNGVLGTRLKLIHGYGGSPAALKAMESGEVDGGFPTMESLKTTRPDWIRDKKINFLLQARQIPDQDLPEVPTANSLATSNLQRQALDFMFPRDVIGRPFMTPPGVPVLQLKLLQDAFAETVNDPELLAEAGKINVPILLTSGVDLQKVISDAYSTRQEIIDYVRQFIPRG